MKNNVLILSFLLLSINVFSQIKFEKGYIINQTNQKIACFINNKDWVNNPTEFEYKLHRNAEVLKGNTKNILEFGIENEFKYKRLKVRIDRSSNNANQLSNQKDPEFKSETLFLSVLVEGKPNLYYYKEGNLTRFFYGDDNSATQLIYKKYLINYTVVAENLEFKQQLWENFKCDQFTNNFYKQVDYKRDDLLTFFQKYNQCINQSSEIIQQKEKNLTFQLNLRPGVTFSKLNLQNSQAQIKDLEFENEINFRIGIEAEFILPFNKNKWSVFVEPAFQSYSSEIDLITKTNTIDQHRHFDIDYKSLELPFGVRHYLFLNNKSKLFLNGFGVVDFPIGSTMKVNDKSYDIKSDLSFGLGVGYTYKKFIIEGRYLAPKNILGGYSLWGSDFTNFSIIFGYTLL